MSELIITQAILDDLPAMTDIYNEAIINTTATFDTETKTVEERMGWFQSHDKEHPILVAKFGEEVVGWATITAWSDRCAYDKTAEESIYIKAGQRGKGLGKKLLKAVLDKGQELGFHTMIARITEGNAGSVYLHELMGFKHIGVMKEVGNKFGKILDVYLMQKIYQPLNQIEVNGITYRAPDENIGAFQFIALAQKVWNRDYDAISVQAAICKTINFTAWDGDNLVGCVRLLSDGYFFGTIPEIMIAPDYQSKGIGKELMRLLWKHSPTGLFFGAQSGKEGFYEELGYEKSMQSYSRRKEVI